MPVEYVIPETMDAQDKSISKRQLILLAHGSRDRNWCLTFEDGLEVINTYLDREATLAYMEMASPSLESVISGYYLRGTREFDILPLFFAAGRHLLHDVPAQIEELQAQYPGANIRLQEAVGRQDVFWQALGGMISNEYDLSATASSVSEAEQGESVTG